MVNMPIGLSKVPKTVNGGNGLNIDQNHNINPEYYKWLLKQHNYFPDSISMKVGHIGRVKVGARSRCS